MLIQRFKESIALFPEAARQLSDSVIRLSDKFGDLKYILIVETFICGYLTRYMSSPDTPVLVDAAKALACLCPMPHPLRRDIGRILVEEELEIDSLLEAMRPVCQSLDDLKSAFDITGRHTLVTTRDLLLLYKGARRYQEFVPAEKQKVLGTSLCGIMEPKVITDASYLQIKVMSSEGSLDALNLRPTEPYDGLADLLNLVDFRPMEYGTPDELQREIRATCAAFISPLLEQRLTPDFLVNTAEVLEDVSQNHITLKSFSEQLCSAIFAAKNERDRLRGQLRSLFQILARSSIVPALVELYPFDFTVREGDLFAPTEAYGRIIENVTARISVLQLTPENEHIVRRTFFLDFVDNIDTAFAFQRMIKVDKMQARFALFCQANADAVTELSLRRAKFLSRAAKTFQWIRCAHSISYNLNVALKAMHPLTVLPSLAVSLAIGMSGNPELPAFTTFVAKYLNDDRIANVIMTKHEQELIKMLLDASRTLTIDERTRRMSQTDRGRDSLENSM
jgi:hypothetical protein